MPTYVVTGAARGLGYEFLRQFNTIPDAVVFGLVRDASVAEKKVSEDGLKNVHILQANMTDRAALKAAARRIKEIVPAVDYLINNGAYLGEESVWTFLSEFEGREDVLEKDLMRTFRVNVVGVVDTINAFLPLIRSSKIKKVVTITSGLADDNLTNQYGVYENAPYSISKAAVNTVSAKYNAKLGKEEGILFLSLSPGLVSTGNNAELSAPADSDMPAKFLKAWPHFTGPITPEESVTKMREVIEKASANNEFAGGFISHLGNKQWL